MKKTKIVGSLAVLLCAGFVACNNSGDNASTTTTDSTITNTNTATTTDNTATTPTTTTTSSNNYAAMADTFRVNSEAGNYLDPRTGKSFKIRMDTATGIRMNDATNEPVWRYVDKRNYKVYSGSSSDNNAMWDTVGTARMQNNRLEYEGDNNSWTSYDKRWRTEDDTRMKDYKTHIGDTKVKVSADGDLKVKDLNTGEKTKYDAQTDKVKTKGGNKMNDKMSADSAQ